MNRNTGFDLRKKLIYFSLTVIISIINLLDEKKKKKKLLQKLDIFQAINGYWDSIVLMIAKRFFIKVDLEMVSKSNS